MNKVIVITGGQRSGKSRFAEKMALSLSEQPVYLATSRIWDDEHRQRIEHHQANRGQEWQTIEEEKELSRHDFSGKTVLVDCVTLWATNFFFDLQSDVTSALEALKSEFEELTRQEATFIFVTNEIGMGEMSPNSIQRKFADLQGWFNQYMAAKADEVHLMVSGISLKIK
ncbi:bifunctional adenosylcobinamide kinase/adenosylcobinamide-phosphate guanylyltransferase [Odoribacter sp. OttesenSCG-928-J03]|nr:bifunctional adenosylcobinamide kinase/adenosylcobinamide-phosphate guanylyltransferase [Odoribacter sp. OttesenSCG-928-J03]MDL2330529.1 bifunctional adenosylcobinamide kinase/adenosylcobinamide-phosphate guanylyltransferase [Odoribacter sp. OttesenSCG-928-A06]